MKICNYSHETRYHEKYNVESREEATNECIE